MSMVDCRLSIIVRVFASRDFPCYCRAYRAVSRELDKKTGHWFFAEKDLVDSYDLRNEEVFAPAYLSGYPIQVIL